ncbi:histidine phosphatase family protein [Catellatospora tritici]|uniref:histidine phosphatase family protein n=1 Tax=Catellatospora tritici TaxID=2851566 RepID=UPI001C2D1323|nr:histidine phosphatase family protein [Catellatospora tritici]MBV1850866.1 histidine phosphatase family protein [Catellatospora tritici]MBV1851119.1 histidine phosphatase family protein [Catellatospora tritici]
MSVRLVYETHSTTTDNEAGIATGWLPGQLSERGLRDAADLARRRRDDGVDLVYCSDLHRAVQTAQLAFGARGIGIRLDARLRECDYGQLNGMPVHRLDRERPQRVDTPFPGGESYRQVVDRTAELLEELADRHDGQRLVLIAHSANRHALAVLLEGADLHRLVSAPFAWQPGWEYELPTAWRR